MDMDRLLTGASLGADFSTDDELKLSNAALIDRVVLPDQNDTAIPAIAPVTSLIGDGPSQTTPSTSPDLNDFTGHGRAGLQIVFVDPGVHDLQALLAGMKPGMDVILLDPHRDALDQIAETLNGLHNVSAIHIIADGESGDIDFSSGALTLGNLTSGSHAQDLSIIERATDAQSDLMIWSCNTGAGAKGQAFIDALAQHTGMDVAASTGPTGDSAMGGNWVLETHTGGPITATVPLTAEGIHNFDSELGVSLSIIYPSYTPSGHNYVQGNNQIGFSYGTAGDNVTDTLYTGTHPKVYYGKTYQEPNWSKPSDFTQFDNKVVFVATNADGRELWITDGTVAGTEMLKDINPGSGSAFPDVDSGTVPMAAVGSELYFAANDGTHGIELWKTDGTAGGTVLVDDIRSGSSGSNPQSFVDFNGALFFTAQDGTTGGTGGYLESALWTSDGSAGGTTKVFTPTVAGGAKYAPSVSDLVVSGNNLFFTGSGGTNATANELYVSDGTAGGTHLLEAHPAENLTNLNGTLFFTMDDGTHQDQVWMSDGTSGGTTMLTDVSPTNEGLGASDFVETTNGEVYFAAYDPTDGYQLWESDGTTNGTEIVKKINASGNSSPEDLTPVGNELYFVATNGSATTIYQTDGLAADTSAVDPSANITEISDLQDVNGTLYFVAASGGVLGLWKVSGGEFVEVANNFSDLSSSDSDRAGGEEYGNYTFLPANQPLSVTSFNAAATSTAVLTAAHTVDFTLVVTENATVAGGTTLSLSDGGTATYVSGSGTQTLIFSYSATDAPSALSVNSISAGSIQDADGNSLAIAGTTVGTYTDAVTDTAAHVSANFDSLENVVSDISSITFSDASKPNLDLTVAQTLNDTTLIGDIVSPYNLVVADTAANVGSEFGSLAADVANISEIVFTDSGTPTLDLTETQVTAHATLLAKVQGPYDLSVTGVTGQAYDSYQSDYNASNVLTQTTDFNNDGSETIYGYVSGLTLGSTADNTVFELQSAPLVTASGTGDNNSFYMGADFSASDSITGGTGTNILYLEGDYTGANAVTLGAATLTGIQEIYLEAANGYGYNLTLNADDDASGQSLKIDGQHLASNESLTFDASATQGSLVIYTGDGTDDITLGGGTADVHGGTGTDTITGGAGNVEIAFTTGFVAADALTGGTGTNELVLEGNYTGGNAVTLDATTLVDFQKIVLEAGNSYDLTLNAATIGSGHTLDVTGANLGASDDFTLDASAQTAGTLDVYTGNGTDDITLGGGTKDFVTGGTGTDTITGGGANDEIRFDSGFTAADSITGGTGVNELVLDGNYTGGNAVTFGASTLLDVQKIVLEGGNSYDLTANAATVTTGQEMVVNGTGLLSGDSLTFDGSAVTNGILVFDAGAESGTLTGGDYKDAFHAGTGVNTFASSGGKDYFYFSAVDDSTGPTYDTITGFNTSTDRFYLPTSVTGIDTAVTVGTLDSGSNFNTELAVDINATNLAAHHAVLFTASLGNLAGQTFLIIDANGTAGYQAGQDYVINVTGDNLAHLSTGNFFI